VSHRLPASSVALLLLVLAALALPFLAGLAQAFGERVFEGNTGISSSKHEVWVDESVAQSFLATETYRLLNVTLRLQNAGGLSDPLNVSIRPDNGNQPAPLAIASTQIVTGSAISLVSVPFPSPPVLQAGRLYWIVATHDGDSSDAYRWYHSNGPTYPNGWAMLNVSGTGWVDTAPSVDMYFVTYGRVYDPDIDLGMTVSTRYALPKDSVAFTIFFNNSGDQPAGQVWINVTLPPGLAYVSDDAYLSSTPFPNYTFNAVGNGPHSFQVIARLDVGVPPGTVLTNRATLTFANGTWSSQPPLAAQASVTVAARKELYLIPGRPGPPHGLSPSRPTGGAASQMQITLPRGSPPVVFDLSPPLATPFDAGEASAVLFVDSLTGNIETLDLNVSLFDWNGVSLVPVAWREDRVLTNDFVDYQPVALPLGAVNHTFLAGHLIRLAVENLATSTSDARVAFNSTFANSRLEFITTTYVEITSLELRDGQGATSVWSPRDSLVVRANVSDPLGTAEIAGARINITSPSLTPVVVNAPMQAILSDSASPPAWMLFEFAFGSPLEEGTYGIEVVAQEGNGVEDVAQASAIVRAPRFNLTKVANSSNVQSGDRFTYDIWFNNTGTATAPAVWINDTLPAEVTLLLSSPAGNLTGSTIRWNFSAVTPGSHLITLDVEVRGGIGNIAYITNLVSLNFSDEKGYRWPEVRASSDVAFQGPVISLSKITNATRVHSNETVSYTITLTNTGDPAGAVWLNDTLPMEFTYVADTAGIVGGTTVVSGNLVEFRLPSMPASTTWSFTLLARAGSGLVAGAVVTNRAELDYTNMNGIAMKPRTAWHNLTVAAPSIPSASFSIGASSARPGDDVAAFLVFANQGNEAAADVWVDLTFDPYLDFVNASVPASASETQVSFQLTNVAVGVMRLFLNFSIDVAATDGQTMSVGGTLDYTDGFGNLFPALAIPTDTVLAAGPRIGLQVTPASATVDAGARISYFITYANAGSRMAGDVWLNLSLPATFTYVSDTADGERAVIGSSYVWRWRSVGPGEKSFRLDLAAKPNVLDGSSSDLPFETAYTDEKGTLRGQLSALARVEFVAPVIELRLLEEAGELRPGDTFAYTLSVRNLGQGTSKNLWLLDSVDERLEIVSYESSVRAEGNPDLNWTFTDITPGRAETVTLAVRIRDGVAPRTLITNVVEAVYTNGDGTVLGYVRSAPVVITIAADPMPLVYILAGGAALGAVAVVVVHRRHAPQIEDVFLVYRDGVLMYHLSRSLVEDKDGDVLTGMLTAVQEFVRDAFRYGEHRELHQLDFGDYRMLIERSQHVYLAVIYSGKESPLLRRKVREVLDGVEASYGPVLEKWDGNMEQVIGARDIIRDRMFAQNGRFTRFFTRAG